MRKYLVDMKQQLNPFMQQTMSVVDREGDKLYEVHYSYKIMPADVCEINNNPSLVKEIIEHILKARYQQKLKTGDGRYQYNENKLAPN